MKQITVRASKEYEVYIGGGLLSEAGKIIRKAAGGTKAFIVTDTNVGPLYADTVKASLQRNGYDTSIYVMEAGEQYKTLETFGDISRNMAREKLTRKDVVVALGGGVVGDIAGFAAGTYMRGISYVQMPTTVLAAVDSSVGGKTAVDLPEGKNLVGAFYQPEAVICDTGTFRSLPERERNSGFAEVIKYAMIADKDLLDDTKDDIEEMIYRCVRIKADIVSEDEFESGKRKLLNFGHTIGHAVEKASGYTLSHGEAVSIGMVAVTDYATGEGLCSKSCKEKLVDALDRYDLPHGTDFDTDEIAGYISSDKKADGGGVDMIIPLEFGRCTIRHIAFDEIDDLLKKVKEWT